VLFRPASGATLSLVKLYQSTRRPAKAQRRSGPAFAGFSPTPEMLEIPEPQALRRDCRKSAWVRKKPLSPAEPEGKGPPSRWVWSCVPESAGRIVIAFSRPPVYDGLLGLVA
jgi:hypothetical protein